MPWQMPMHALRTNDTTMRWMRPVLAQLGGAALPFAQANHRVGLCIVTAINIGMDVTQAVAHNEGNSDTAINPHAMHACQPGTQPASSCACTVCSTIAPPAVNTLPCLSLPVSAAPWAWWTACCGRGPSPTLRAAAAWSRGRCKPSAAPSVQRRSMCAPLRPPALLPAAPGRRRRASAGSSAHPTPPGCTCAPSGRRAAGQQMGGGHCH